MNEENQIAYYAVILSTVLFSEKLKANEKLLYAVITVMSNKEGYCFASNSYLAKLFNSQPHTISNWISNLNKLKFVCVEIIRNDKNEITQRRIYPNDIPYSIKMTYPYTTKITESMSQKGQYNNINIKIDRFFNYIIKKEDKNLKYRITYNTNKRTDIEIAKDLSTTKNNTIDFTKEKLSEGEYVTSYTLHFGTVKIGFSNSTQMKVKTKVVEGLVDDSTFINNVKVVGHYLEAKAEDDAHTIIYTKTPNIEKELPKTGNETRVQLLETISKAYDDTIGE